MTLHLLRGRGRTKEDRAFYRAALEFQQKHHLSNGATADEYSKKARAFHLKINPNLAQPYTGEDISEYIIDLMPSDLRESGRRLTAQMKRDGTYLDHPEVIHECQELVRQEQSKSKTASAPPPCHFSLYRRPATVRLSRGPRFQHRDAQRRHGHES